MPILDPKLLFLQILTTPLYGALGSFPQVLHISFTPDTTV